MKYVLFLVCLFVSSGPLRAAEYQLENLTYRGNGCPQGSIESSLSEDHKTMVFKLNSIEVASPVPQTVKRKACSLAVPVRVSPGYSIAVLPIKYTGYASIGSGAFGAFTVETFFAGQKGEDSSSKFNSGFDSVFEHTDPSGPLMWSPCGGDVTWRVNLSLLANSPNMDVPAHATLDKIGPLQFEVKRCDSADLLKPLKSAPR